MSPARDIQIRDEAIRLGQLLKLANIVGSGADVKLVLGTEDVLVNGEIETRRGRTIHPGDEVTYGDISLRVTTTAS